MTEDQLVFVIAYNAVHLLWLFESWRWRWSSSFDLLHPKGAR